MGGAIRVAVVDDHPLFREGVASVLQGAGSFDIVGQGSGANDLLRLAREQAPDIILADLNLCSEGINAIRHVAQARPATRMIVLTMSESEAHVSTAMKAGVAGYVLKGVTGIELARTVRDVHLGARYVDPALAARILARQVSAPSAHHGLLSELTSREGQIVGQVARGLTNKEVARALALSEKTVKHYMTSIMQKLQVRNRTELVLIASSQVDNVEVRASRNIV